MPSSQSIIAAAGSTVITVTVGTDATNYGYTTSFGSRSPTLLYGQNINAIYCNPTTPLVQVQVTGIVTATFFNRVTFKYGASGATSLSLTSASASFGTGGGFSTWSWTNSTFSATDNGLARFVIFYR